MSKSRSTRETSSRSRTGDIEHDQWGQLEGMDINPRIPPEGTDAYIYDVRGVKLSFQFLHHSRTLRSIALEWR